MRISLPYSRIRSLLIGAFCIPLCSCALIDGPSPATLELPLLPPSELQQQQVNQALRITTELRSEESSSTRPRSDDPDNLELLALWSTRGNNFQIAILTDTGQPILSASYNGKRVTENTIIELPKPLSARQLISQIQMAYWPEDRIRWSLKDSNWNLTVKNGVRYLTRDNKPVITITRHSNEHLTLYHHWMKLSVDITTLRRVALP